MTPATTFYRQTPSLSLWASTKLIQPQPPKKTRASTKTSKQQKKLFKLIFRREKNEKIGGRTVFVFWTFYVKDSFFNVTRIQTTIKIMINTTT